MTPSDPVGCTDAFVHWPIAAGSFLLTPALITDPAAPEALVGAEAGGGALDSAELDDGGLDSAALDAAVSDAGGLEDGAALDMAGLDIAGLDTALLEAAADDAGLIAVDAIADVLTMELLADDELVDDTDAGLFEPEDPQAARLNDSAIRTVPSSADLMFMSADDIDSRYTVGRI